MISEFTWRPDLRSGDSGWSSLIYQSTGTGTGTVQSDIPEYRKIAESLIIPADDSNYHAMTRNELLTQRTHAVIKSYMIPGELRLTTQYNPYRENYKYNRGRGYYRIVLLYRIWYYRGERLNGTLPISGYLTNKKWHLNEVKLFIYLIITSYNILIKKFIIPVLNS